MEDKMKCKTSRWFRNGKVAGTYSKRRAARYRRHEAKKEAKDGQVQG